MALANPLALATPSSGQRITSTPSPAPLERRRRARSRVNWPVLLFRNLEGGDTVETITRDLSSSGFYCLSAKPFAVGEQLLCALQVPADNGESRLECRVRVVRVEENVLDGQYGIACRTQDYRFANARVSRIPNNPA